jgi:HTH-type transcriptional regulator, global nitrogen regulator NrpRI
MNINKQRKIAAILSVLKESGKPIGSNIISERLISMGFDLRERMIRYYLNLTDEKEMTKNLGRRGHVITNQGRKELDVAVAIDKVGFVNARIDELAYRMDFDESNMTGAIIMNMSTIKTENPQHVIKLVTDIMTAKLGMGAYLQIVRAGETIENPAEKVPGNHIVIGTVCSVTINGILLRHGIHMSSRFGGLLELNEGVPVRFSQIINYDGSTIDPLEIFIKGKMMSVIQAAQTGTGSIGASFREVSIAALSDVKRIIENLEKIGLGGVLMIGRPNQPLLDIPVSTGCAGLVITGGLNPIGALEESGIATVNQSLHNLRDFDQLTHIETIA